MTVYTVDFSDNIYYIAAQSAEQFRDQYDVIEKAKSSLDFSYANVDFEAYSHSYSPEGWISRKITALPMALWSGVVLTICNIAYGLLLIPFAIPCYAEYKKNYKEIAYSIVRDLQDSFGRIASLFHDAYGSYHIEASAFHRRCYTISSSDPINGWVVKDSSTEEVQKVKEGVQERKKEWYAKDFPEKDSLEHRKQVYKGDPTPLKLKRKFLQKMDSADLWRESVYMQAYDLGLVPKERLNELNYDMIAEGEIEACYAHFRSGYTLRDIEVTRERLQSLSTVNFNKVLRLNSKNDVFPLYIPIEHFNSLNYAELTQRQVAFLFYGSSELVKLFRDEVDLRKLIEDQKYIMENNPVEENRQEAQKKHRKYAAQLSGLLEDYEEDYLRHPDRITELQDDARERLATLSEENFRFVASKFLDRHFSVIPDTCLNWLDYAGIGLEEVRERRIRALFPDDEENQAHSHQRLLLLSAENRRHVLNSLTPDQRNWLERQP